LKVRDIGVKSSEGNSQHAATTDPKRAAKKPYVKPQVRHERVFETMALSCGKVGTTQQGCTMNRKTS
jgi:hypothetical protein